MSKDFVQLAKYIVGTFISSMYIRFMSYSPAVSPSLKRSLFRILGVGLSHCTNYAIVFSCNFETMNAVQSHFPT